MLPAAVAGTLPRPQAIARASVSALVASLPLLYVSLLRPPPAALAGDTAFWFLMSNCVIAAIVAISDDAGTLLFRSSAPDDDNPCFDGGGGGGGISFASADPLPVAAQGVVVSGGGDAVVLLAAASSQDETAPAVDVDVNGAGRVQEEAASAVTSSYSVHHALPTLIEGEEEEEEEEEETRTIEPSAAKNNTVEVVEAQGEENTIEVIPLATIEEGSALADPDDELEPWSRVVLTSTKSLPEEEEGGAAAAREGGLRRSATVGSAPAADEESEYWRLSDEELNRRVEDFIARFNREMRLQIEQEARV